MSITHPFAVAIEAGDEEAALAMLADGVVFRSPAVYRPYEGRSEVEKILRLVAAVFEDFRYANEWRDGRTTILFFETHVGNRELQGVDILEHDDAGKIAAFTVMIRPLSGLQAVAARMSERIASV